MSKMPVLFVSHGAPDFAVEESPLTRRLMAIGRGLAGARAAVVVSPHWMTPEPRVTGHPRPPTIHDFRGFGARLERLEYAAPGAPELAAELVDRLNDAGWAARLDRQRGLDHGAWVPLMHLFPDAAVPIVQLSLPRRLDAPGALAFGRALAPLAEAGVVVIGSGSLTHNLHEVFHGARDVDYARAFSEWVREAVLALDFERLARALIEAPFAQRAHPTPEHYWPLLVAAGAAGDAGASAVIDGGVRHRVLVMDAFVFVSASDSSALVNCRCRNSRFPMQITVRESGTRTTKRNKKRNKLQARFDRLRERIERERRKNEKLGRELDELADWLATQLEEIDRSRLEACRDLCARLIELFRRKSLAKWEREALVDWISELQNDIRAIDADTHAELHRKFVDAMGHHFQMTEEQMQARFAEHLESLREELEGDLDDEFDDEFDSTEQPELFDDVDDGADPWFEREEAAWEPPPFQQASSAGARLANADWLRRLFRRAAQALHPDREADPDKRADKQARMQRLLHARKEGDMLAMLELYAEVSGDEELALAEDEMKQACQLLDERVDRLLAENEEILMRSPLHLLAWQEFYRVKPATRKRKLQRMKKDAEANAHSMARTTRELKNLKVLKVKLDERLRERYDAIDVFESLHGNPFT